MPPPFENNPPTVFDPIASATVLALEAITSAIFACVNSCVIDINANNNPEYFITCWDSFPIVPPAIDPAPASVVNANVPPIRALFIESRLFLVLDTTGASSCCCGAPCGLVALLLCLVAPLCVPPTAAAPSDCPDAETSSC